MLGLKKLPACGFKWPNKANPSPIRNPQSKILNHIMLSFTAKGIYCSQAGVYIDPWRRVEKAIVTHAHGDHAYRGHKHYIAHHTSEQILRLRLGKNIHLKTLSYNAPFYLNGVQFSLHPAGHIYGSAQVRVEYKGEVWVVSGDYKTEADGISQAFEPVPCHTFITESTFAMPIYQWKPQDEIFAEINEWWRENQAAGKVSVLFGYSLGKTQRILCNVDHSIGPLFVHQNIANVNEALRQDGAPLPEVPVIGNQVPKSKYKGSLVIAPTSVLNTQWLDKFKPYATGKASGWMALRATKPSRIADRGFVLSDHADWNGLLSAIEATGASRVFATHGYKSTLVRYLNEQGYEAYEAETLFEGESIGATPGSVRPEED